MPGRPLVPWAVGLGRCRRSALAARHCCPPRLRPTGSPAALAAVRRPRRVPPVRRTPTGSHPPVRRPRPVVFAGPSRLPSGGGRPLRLLPAVSLPAALASGWPTVGKPLWGAPDRRLPGGLPSAPRRSPAAGRPPPVARRPPPAARGPRPVVLPAPSGSPVARCASRLRPAPAVLQPVPAAAWREGARRPPPRPQPAVRRSSASRPPSVRCTPPVDRSPPSALCPSTPVWCLSYRRLPQAPPSPTTRCRQVGGRACQFNGKPHTTL